MGNDENEWEMMLQIFSKIQFFVKRISIRIRKRIKYV